MSESRVLVGNVLDVAGSAGGFSLAAAGSDVDGGAVEEDEDEAEDEDEDDAPAGVAAGHGWLAAFAAALGLAAGGDAAKA